MIYLFTFFVFHTKHKEPSPAKMAATDPVQSSCGQWQEEQRGRGPDVTPIWTVTDTEAAGPEQTPAGATECRTHTHTHTHKQAFESISQS